MMEENGSKKVLLSVLGVAILVVAVVGISFAAFNATKESDANTISTGTISMSYSEATNGIEILDALPTSDSNGMALNGDKNVFDFTVSTNASGTLNIPYEISITPVAATTGYTALADSQVKVYLTKGGTAVVGPTLISALDASEVDGRTGSKTLYTQTDSHTGTGEAVTSNYTLKMWIDNAVNVNDATGKEYRLKVNVDASVAPLN